jgi:hypothetical protein
VKCSASITGYMILGFLAAVGIVEAAAAQGLAAPWCYLLGIFGGGLTGLAHCLD